MRKRSTGLLPFSAESGGERVICPDRAGLEKIEIGDPKGGKNGWIRCTARGMLIAGTFKGTSQIRETQAVQGVRALLKEVPLSPPGFQKAPRDRGLLAFLRRLCLRSCPQLRRGMDAGTPGRASRNRFRPLLQCK